MKFKKINFIILIILTVTAVSADENTGLNLTISYNTYLEKIEKSLPEIKSNDIDIQKAENEINRSKANGDFSFNAGGTSYSSKQYNGINTKGDLEGYNYYAGLSKKIKSTGTNISTTYNYTSNSYNNFSTTPDYSTYEPSVSLKVSQPLLYNFLGKVDKYSENNAKLQLEIEKINLDENNKSVLNSYKKLYFEWILYNEILADLEDAIKNSIQLKDQTYRKVRAGLADNDDYQKAASSVITYERQFREYQTTLNNIKHQLSLYIDSSNLAPDKTDFSNLLSESIKSEFAKVPFSRTDSALIITKTMNQLVYSREVSENRLLPEFNVFSEITKKDRSESSTYVTKDTDYVIGFEFKYSLGNNAAESSLRDVELQIKSLNHETDIAVNSYSKNLLTLTESASGLKYLLKKNEESIKLLNSRLATEKIKYNQARLNLSYLIETENSITSEKISLMTLKYQLISCYIDYRDLIK